MHPVKTQMIPQTFLEAHMVQAPSVDVPWALNEENETEWGHFLIVKKMEAE